MLGESSFSPAIQRFLNQVRKRPQDFKKLLLTVTLHPDPTASVIWNKQTLTFGKQTIYLIDEVVLSGQSTEVVAELREISDASFKQQIEAERTTQLYMTCATQGLDKVLIKAYLYDACLLPPAPGGSLDYVGLSKLARELAQKVLPKDLAKRIMNSEASEAHLACLGSVLRRYAEKLLRTDPHFKGDLEIARKVYRELEQGRKQRGTKKVQ